MYFLKYHHFSGNLHIWTTSQNFFRKKVIENVLFPSGVTYALNSINMSLERYIQQHSVIPFYRIFVEKENYEQILKDYSSCSTMLFRGASKKGKRETLAFCPACLKETNSFYAIERYQEIEGVHVCHRHRCYLNEITRIELKQWLDDNDTSVWNLTERKCEDPDLLGIAKDIDFILKHQPELDIIQMKQILGKKQSEKGIKFNFFAIDNASLEIRKNACNKAKEYQKFYEKFVIPFLAGKVILRDTNPIEYLLLIREWYGSFENFVNEEHIELLYK